MLQKCNFTREIGSIKFGQHSSSLFFGPTRKIKFYDRGGTKLGMIEFELDPDFYPKSYKGETV